ncbi:RNA polymerase sigma factor WhiG [Candidatus Zixiibacteriota bacterium]|nr:RNA polymerase sigma factor WhiG [candidate division Zixibacteria bacterium]
MITTTRKPKVKRVEAKAERARRISVYKAPEEEVKAERKVTELTVDWIRYQRDGNPMVRARLLRRYLPLVRNVAGRMAIGFPRSVELSDLINTGVIGLVEAFRNFDPGRGVKFETYAVPRIRGAILDELRALDWVPRSTRARSREIERALLSLENDYGRPPTDSELAEKLGCTVEELMLAIGDVTGSSLLSLDETIYREDDNHQVPRIETVRDEHRATALGELEKDELRAFLVTAIDRLTEQEKLVIALYYFEELTLKEIGEVMSISESRVSQIHTKAVLKLRGMIRERFALSG